MRKSSSITKRSRRRAFIVLLILLMLTLSISITLTMYQESDSTLQRSEQEKLLSLRLNDMDEAISMVVQMMKRDELNKAEELLQAITKKYPRESDPQLLLGTVYFRQKRYDKAELIFKSILLDFPDNAAASNNLGETLIKLNRLPEAAVAIDNAVKFAPDNGEIALNAANISAMLGEDAKALKYLLLAQKLGISAEDITRYKDLIKLLEKPEILKYFNSRQQKISETEN